MFPCIDIHLRVRNDERCPHCRRFFLTYNLIPEKLTEKQQSCVTWEDEWIRRRNGDRYQSIVPIFGKTYDLLNWDVREDTTMFADESNDTEQTYDDMTESIYMCVYESFDDEQYCPKRDIFVSFHKSEKEAVEKTFRFITQKECIFDCLSELDEPYDTYPEFSDESYNNRIKGCENFVLQKLNNEHKIMVEEDSCTRSYMIIRLHTNVTHQL